MKGVARTTLLLGIVHLISLSAIAQAPPGGAPNTSTRAVLTGVVVRSGTGEPIPRAQVTISRVAAPIPGAPTGRTAGQRGVAVQPPQQDATQFRQSTSQPAGIPSVTTDDNGRFGIKDVEPGSYRIYAARNGFMKQEYGQRSPNRPGLVVTVQPGQQLQDLTFRLSPASTITGRVTDALTGDPLPGITVQAMRSTYDASGKRTLQAAASDRTNDLGEYRLYWINPGRYFVTATAARSGFDALLAATSQAASFAPAPSPAEAQQQQQAAALFGPPRSANEIVDSGYPLAYYPGTPEVSRASTIDLQPGAETHADFNLSKGEKYRIRGRAIDATTGRPPRDASLSVSPRNATGGAPVDALFGAISGMIQGNTKYNSDTGEFEMRDVAPGSYWLQAMVANFTPGAAGATVTFPNTDANPLANLPFNTTQIAVDVFGGDVEGLTLAVSPGVSIPGRIRVEGVSNANQNPLALITLSLQPSSGGGSILSALAGNLKPAADGTFTIQRVTPGDYKLLVSGLSPNTYVREARLEQADALEGVTIGTRVDGILEIVLSQNPGQLDGTVLGADLKPVSGVQAVLVPERLRNRLDLYKTAITNPDGRFTIRGLPPGDYRVLAWEDIEPFAYFDPEVLMQYDGLGKTVRIQEGSSQTAEVRIIPAGQ
jgi:protocatechuate 3,4-dioxygenase beta subunit